MTGEPPPLVVSQHKLSYRQTTNYLTNLSTLLSVQFGTEHPDVSTSLKPTVSQLAQDPTVAVQERAKVFSRSCGSRSLDHTSFLSPCSVLFFLGSLGSFRRLTCTR